MGEEKWGKCWGEWEEGIKLEGMRLGSWNRGGWDWNWRDGAGMEKRWGGEGGGQQQSLMLPWKHVYASLMHLVDPIRGWLCLHRHMHACSGVTHAHARTHACLLNAFAHKMLKILLLQNHKFVGDFRQSTHAQVTKTGTTGSRCVYPQIIYLVMLLSKKNGQERWKSDHVHFHRGRYSLWRTGISKWSFCTMAGSLPVFNIRRS